MSAPTPLEEPLPERGPKSVWKTAGLVLVVVVALAGLTLLAVAVFFFIALNNWGSNK